MSVKKAPSDVSVHATLDAYRNLKKDGAGQLTKKSKEGLSQALEKLGVRDGDRYAEAVADGLLTNDEVTDLTAPGNFAGRIAITEDQRDHLEGLNDNKPGGITLRDGTFDIAQVPTKRAAAPKQKPLVEVANNDGVFSVTLNKEDGSVTMSYKKGNLFGLLIDSAKDRYTIEYTDNKTGDTKLVDFSDPQQIKYPKDMPKTLANALVDTISNHSDTPLKVRQDFRQLILASM